VGHAGLTNTITAVKNCQMAESPLLLLGGAAATLLKVRGLRLAGTVATRMPTAVRLDGQGRGALQDIDQLVLFKPLCKACFSIQK
jgi:acetolactate synthase-like protein